MKKGYIELKRFWGILPKSYSREGIFDLSGYDNVVDAVLGVITRHPMLEEELIATLDRWTPGQVQQALAEVEASGKAKAVLRYGQRFWSFVGARYAPDRVSVPK
jgi:hypothetical protein